MSRPYGRANDVIVIINCFIHLLNTCAHTHQSRRRIQLVPYFSSPAPSSDEHNLSDSERPVKTEHLYSLGKFVSVDPLKKAKSPVQPLSQSATRGSPPGPARRATHCAATHVRNTSVFICTVMQISSKVGVLRNITSRQWTLYHYDVMGGH